MNMQEQNQVPTYLLVLTYIFVFYLFVQAFAGSINIYSYILMAILMGWAIQSKQIESKIFLAWTSLTQAIVYVSLLFILFSGLYTYSYLFSDGPVPTFGILHLISYLIFIFLLINLHRFYKKQLVATGGISKMRKFFVILLAVIMPLMPFAEWYAKETLGFRSTIEVSQTEFDWMRAISFSPDGSKIATIFNMRDYLRIWDVKTGKLALEVKAPGTVKEATFSPDGRYVALGHRSASQEEEYNVWLKVWDFEKNQEVILNKKQAIEKASQYISAGIIDDPVVFSPDGKYLATVIRKTHSQVPDSFIYFIGFWDTKTWELVRIIDLKTKERGISLSLNSIIRNQLLFTPDGNYLAIRTALEEGGGDGVCLFDVSSGALAKKFIPPDDTGVEFFTFSPDGKYLATTASVGFATATEVPKNIIEIWDMQTTERLKRFPTDGGIADSLAYSPDGRYLAIGEGYRHVFLWDTKQDVLKKTLRDHPKSGSGFSNWVVFSPDGRYLAAGKGRFIKFWDVSEMK